MIQIDDMATFVAVVESGSLTAAADRLDTTKSVVSRRLGDLEKELGITLLERGARGARTTEVGAVYYAKCVRILESIEAANEFASGFNNIVSGMLKVVIAPGYHDVEIAALLNRFALEHPEVILQVDAFRPGGLAETDFDVALHPGDPDDSDLIARPLFEFNRVMCASPGYLQQRGMPATPEELAGHDALLGIVDGSDVWRHRSGENWSPLRVRERMRCIDHRQLLEAARAGLGVVLAPEAIVADDLSTGRLALVLPGLELPRGHVTMLYARSRRASRKVQLLLEFLFAMREHPVPGA